MHVSLTSKAFDFIDHEFLIPKLHAYEFDTNGLKFSYSYLKERKLMTKIISSYNSFGNVLFGISEGSILGLLLFNAYISDIFDDIDDLDFCKFFG